MKIFGPKRGIILSGILGGIVSSVAVTISMANDAKKNSKIFYSAIFSVIVASSTMFLRIFFISSIFNYNLSFHLFAPLAILSILGYFCALGYMEKIKKEKPKLILRSPLELKTALRFGLFFMLTMMLVNVAKNYFSETVVYPIALITGLADVDAMVISLSSLAFTSISPSVAIKGIILTAIANTFSKWLLTFWLGAKKMALDVGKVFLVLILLGIAFLFFI
jgi:uncharacterized membrane protein (DUF4010 family)